MKAEILSMLIFLSAVSSAYSTIDQKVDQIKHIIRNSGRYNKFRFRFRRHLQGNDDPLESLVLWSRRSFSAFEEKFQGGNGIALDVARDAVETLESDADDLKFRLALLKDEVPRMRKRLEEKILPALSQIVALNERIRNETKFAEFASKEEEKRSTSPLILAGLFAILSLLVIRCISAFCGESTQ